MRALLVFVGLTACSAPVVMKQPTVEPLPAFELRDVNPASASAGALVGPLTLRGKVSGWYFTHSN